MNCRQIWLRRVDVGHSLPEKYKGETASRAKRERLKINKLINKNNKYHHHLRATDLRIILSFLLCMKTVRRSL